MSTDSSTNTHTSDPLDPDMFTACRSAALPMRMNIKWATKIMSCLRGGPRRFTELLVPLQGITAKVLTESLRAMERDGIVSRTAYPGVPQRVEYDLTELGRSLLGPIDAWCVWAEEHLDDLLDAREAHELRRT
ncbi:MAG TPA: helix-turn-helix domain-containing protein [Actinocrinis sp.]|nr:helix-turn-helix domain-containing protein [Actinocrinis sp.]